MKKICNKCKVEKDVSEFYKKKDSKDGYCYSCKKCSKELREGYFIEYNKNNKDEKKKWRENNKEKIIEYRENNKEKTREYNKEYNIKNKEKIQKIQKNYIKNNRELINKKRNIYIKERKINDTVFKLKCNLSSRLSGLLKEKGYTKKSRTYEILGISYEEFKSYIEEQFEDWMNWNNYGKYNRDLDFGWDLDHIIPISLGETEEEIIKLNHYTNFQPLCSKVNRDIKKNKLNYE